MLLRRTADYEVRRYPVHVSIGTPYERRIDAFGTLGAYTNGANEAGTELLVSCSAAILLRPAPQLVRRRSPTPEPITPTPNATSLATSPVDRRTCHP